MNNFGLGLVLSFTDNATSGIQKATGAFNDLEGAVNGVVSASSKDQALLNMTYAAGIMGNELYSIGRNIVSIFSNAVNQVTDVGNSILNARTQLSQLYGSAEAGNAVLDRVKDYASKSMFSFENLIPTVVMFKSHGVEAFNEIATSAYRATNGVEGASQTILDYASDLAAFNPSMRNVYGSGIEAAMGAIKEYIAEGNTQFLKRGASLDITSLLGEEVGKTIDERSRQIADLIEKMGMVGMTANLASTPTQKLANMTDVLYNLLSDIADSGVMDLYTSLISKISDYITSIPKEELINIANIISSALVELIQPLEKIIDFAIQIIDKVRDLVKENPELMKNIIKGVAIAGAITLIAGSALKLLSTLGMLKFSLSKLFGGSILISATKFLGLIKSITFYFGPLIAAVFLLKTAWDRNFLDMQDRVKKFVRDTIDTFKILFDAWGDYTLSEDNFERAKQLGLLPFIEAVLQLKYHLGFLVKGLKDGFNAFFDGIAKALTKMGILDNETHGLRDLITSLLEKITAPGMTDTWERVGYWIGRIGGWVLVIVSVLPVVLKLVKAIVAVVKIIGVVIGLITTPIIAIPLLIVGIIAAIYMLYKHWDKVWEAIKNDILIKIEVIKAVIAQLKNIPIIGAIIEKIEQRIERIKKVISTIIDVVKVVAGYISNVVSNIKRIIGNVLEFLAPIINKFKELTEAVWGLIQNVAYAIYEIVRAITLSFRVAFNWLNDTIIQPIAEKLSKFVTWFNDNILTPVVNAVQSAFNWINDHIIQPVFNGIKTFIEDTVKAISDFISPIIDRISEAISNTIDKVISYVNVAKKIFGGVGDFFKGVGDDLENMLGLSTGGYVKETGAAVLHPNEVVLNDILTQRLGNFLKEYDYAKTHDRSPLVTQNIIATDDYKERDNQPQAPADYPRYDNPSPVQTYINNTTSSADTNSGDTDIDNSVVFESGSIVFNVDKDTDLANMSEAELGAIAEKLMRIMARKAQLRTMQTRK